MVMWNMWWHFRFFIRSDSFSKLLDGMSDKLSWIFDMSVINNSSSYFSARFYVYPVGGWVGGGEVCLNFQKLNC